MNEPLLKATLLVILDGQAALYAMAMTRDNYMAEDSDFEKYVEEYKKATYQLILEALSEATHRSEGTNAAQDDTS